MASNPLSSVGRRAAGLVTQVVEQAISSGKLEPGTRLRETQLAEEIGVSRTSVREGLYALQEAGLVTLLPNRGALVRRLTRKELSEYFQVRKALEGLAASLVARRVDEKGVRPPLVGLLAEVGSFQRGEPTRSFAEHDEDMHRTIMEACNNQLLCDHWKRLRMPIHRLRFMGGDHQLDRQASISEHHKLLTSILTGDDVGAAAVSAAHLDRVQGIAQCLSDQEFDRIFNSAGNGSARAETSGVIRRERRRV